MSEGKVRVQHDAFDEAVSKYFDGSLRTRSELGELIRRWRKAAGETLVTLAAKSGIHYSHLSRIERGLMTLGERDLRTILDVLNVGELQRDTAVAIARELRQEALIWTLGKENEASTFADRLTQFSELVWECSVFRSFRATVIAGLLQTSSYARGMFEKNLMVLGAETSDVDAMLRARLQAQSVLRDSSKQFEMIIHESAFWVTHADPQVMIEQALRIVEIPLDGNIRVSVIPAGTPLPCSVTDFTVLDDVLVSLDSLTDCIAIRFERHVRRYLLAFEALNEVALHGQACREYLLDLALRLGGGAPVPGVVRLSGA